MSDERLEYVGDPASAHPGHEGEGIAAAAPSAGLQYADEVVGVPMAERMARAEERLALLGQQMYDANLERRVDELDHVVRGMIQPATPRRGLTPEEISDRVRYYAPSQAGAKTHGKLSAAAGAFLAAAVELGRGGREPSLAPTKIEEAKMWASAGVARNPETR